MTETGALHNDAWRPASFAASCSRRVPFVAYSAKSLPIAVASRVAKLKSDRREGRGQIREMPSQLVRNSHPYGWLLLFFKLNLITVAIAYRDQHAAL
eukprot:2009222-Pleurochrysis_carterae.AAC.1